MTRIVPSHVEIEGHVYERLTIWSGTELPPWPANVDLSVVGRSIERVDGVAKVTGRARYTNDQSLPGQLTAQVLRSPHAHARICRLDTSRAAAMPGVNGVICYRSTPCLRLPNGQPLFDRTLHFAGQPVAAVAAETADQADAALAQLQVTYEELPFAVNATQAAEPGAPLVQACGNLPPKSNPQRYQRGDLGQGEAEAEVVVDLTVETPIAIHACLEPHCAISRWDGEQLTVWTSTQYVSGIAGQIAGLLQVPESRVQVISQAIGGAFGSKQFVGEEVVLSALLARMTGRPVSLYLDREAESVATGYREPTHQHLRLGARRDGTLTFIEHTVVNGIGAYGVHRMEVVGPSQRLYRCPNVSTSETLVWTNLAPARAFRGPGYVEGTFALELAMDELARRLDQDPLLLRRKNLAEIDQVAEQPYSTKPLEEAYNLGAAAVGWDDPKPAASRPQRRRGRGVASQIWGGGGGPPAYAWVQLDSGGTATVVLGSQDIGTGTRTALTQIAAEALGFRPVDVRISEGDSAYGPYAPASGGSMTVASVGPAVRAAAEQARGILLDAAAQHLKQSPESLSVVEGEIRYGLVGERHLSVADLLKQLAPFAIVGQGDRAPNPRGLTVNTFGAQFAEVEVDVETGEIEVLRIVAAHDCGRVVSPRQAESQVDGGVTQGLGYALMEQQIVDPHTGIVLNPNLESYLIPTIADVPPIQARLLDEIDPLDNNLGVKGLGEPPIIPTAPAIANAVADAIGVPVLALPLTRPRVLAACKQAKEKNRA
jgi:xanthine dehydrogenase YagR molybdenum-binding subunit